MSALLFCTVKQLIYIYIYIYIYIIVEPAAILARVCPPCCSRRPHPVSGGVAGMASWEESHGTPTWTVALHGTSIRAASRILKSGFEPARNETAGVSGVYLEGIPRMENVLQYVIHTHDEPLPLNFVAGVILEAMIDPHFTKTVHREWVQPDPHSVVVVAALVHIVDVQAVLCACVSYSTEDEEVEDDWTICLIYLVQRQRVGIFLRVRATCRFALSYCSSWHIPGHSEVRCEGSRI